MIHHLIGGLAALGLGSGSLQSEFTVVQQAEVIEALRSLVGTELFDPGLEPAYGEALDAYEPNLMPAEEFALRLHRAVQAVAQDGHFGVYGPQRASQLFGQAMHAGHDDDEASDAHGQAVSGADPWFEIREPLPGRITVRLQSFPSDQAAEELIQALLAHGNVQRLVIDLRGNSGGDAGTFRLIANCLMAEAQPLYAIRWRRGDVFHTDTHHVQPDQRCSSLNEVPILFLVDAQTASVGELMPFIFQRRGRAVVAGEVSWGASHAAELYRLPHGFAAMLPIGATHDPVDGSDWEQVGVWPDFPFTQDP